jgi:two-component system, sensor histidine kinase
MNFADPPITKTKLPWWTWVAPFLIIHFGSQISLLFKYDQGVSTFYLPTTFALVLINWWGVARVLPAMWIVVTLNTYFWGIEEWWRWPILGLPEVLSTLLSYILFSKILKGKFWLPSTRDLILFVFFGLSVPILFELTLLQITLVYFNEQTLEKGVRLFLQNWLGESTANFGITLPLLYSLSPWMQKQHWLINPPEFKIQITNDKTILRYIETIAIYFLLLLLSLTVPFETYWFAYGLAALYIAIRFGFGEALFCNLFVIIILYIVPILSANALVNQIDDTFYSIMLGNMLLSLFVAITGRVITDLRVADKKLHQQNKDLEEINKELDRFVYSASHDLSAPLKSILGLVSVSKLDNISNSEVYLHEIEKSVKKLDSFIKEILDYSRNKRKEVITEQIKLKELCEEIITNLKYTEGFEKIKVEMEELSNISINQDKMRIRIILNNLLSNAVKFQKNLPGHQAIIKISAERIKNHTLIKVEDNGEGIHSDLQDKVFEMFFRGSEAASGSGLGLYIAKESAQKIGGQIKLDTQYGSGSTFTLDIPDLS